MADPTITVTSLGERGVEAVFGVIFPPQVAIVGFGTLVERPWISDGQVLDLPGRERESVRRPSRHRRPPRECLPRRRRPTAPGARGPMSRDEIKEAVLRALSDVAPEADPSTLRTDVDLRDQLDIDSMDFLNFVIGIHEQRPGRHPGGRLPTPPDPGRRRRLRRREDGVVNTRPVPAGVAGSAPASGEDHVLAGGTAATERPRAAWPSGSPLTHGHTTSQRPS